MVDDASLDDPGTILDSYESALPQLSFPVPAARPSGKVEEVLYNSPYRWKAPRILVCDDGSLDKGEVVYVRSDRIVIGRTKGGIVIRHDAAMSGAHAEIVRKEAGGRHAWVLRDLGSSNGTLARAKAVTLRAGIGLLLGAKRYRFEQPSVAEATQRDSDEVATFVLSQLAGTSSDALPALVESGTGARYSLKMPRTKIGRPGFGNDIEIDDHCLAGIHAVINQDHSGVWQLEAAQSLNGVWVKIEHVKLIDNCLFQCGEQRFRFLF